MIRKHNEVEPEKVHFEVGDEVWRKGGYFYQRNTITAVDGKKVMLGDNEAALDDLLPVSIFAVSDKIKGLTYETHIYDFLVFRTYTSNELTDMENREKAEGLYVEKSEAETYRREHFPNHPSGKADVLRLLANLAEQA